MGPRMKNLIEVSVDSIRIHMPTAQHLVILKEKEADRYLPIWIGSFEAQAIATKISGNPLGRPLTHDLMARAFGDLGVSVQRILVETDVMEAAGIIPEADESASDKDKLETPIDDERLAVFRDFVNSLDLPELPDEPKAKDEPGGRPGRG